MQTENFNYYSVGNVKLKNKRNGKFIIKKFNKEKKKLNILLFRLIKSNIDKNRWMVLEFRCHRRNLINDLIFLYQRKVIFFRVNQTKAFTIISSKCELG